MCGLGSVLIFEYYLVNRHLMSQVVYGNFTPDNLRLFLNTISLMNTIRVVHDQFIRTQVIAHRGPWKKTRTSENSPTPLNNAIKLGCMGSEFDVHMPADPVVVSMHNLTHR